MLQLHPIHAFQFKYTVFQKALKALQNYNAMPLPHFTNEHIEIQKGQIA